jgi:hypothetical protein
MSPSKDAPFTRPRSFFAKTYLCAAHTLASGQQATYGILTRGDILRFGGKTKPPAVIDIVFADMSFLNIGQNTYFVKRYLFVDIIIKICII